MVEVVFPLNVVLIGAGQRQGLRRCNGLGVVSTAVLIEGRDRGYHLTGSRFSAADRKGVPVNSVRDIDVTKGRLSDSVSSARDVTAATLRDDVAPVVIAAVEAARELSRPAYEDATARAADAMSSFRDSDAILRLSGKNTRSRSRWPFVFAAVVVGAAGFAIVKRRSAGSGETDVTESADSRSG
jgi:hypothetical protein